MQTNPIRRLILVAAALAGLASCDGPNEKAGRKADQAAAAQSGSNYTGEGVNERLGEAKDKVERANAEAADAAADALERRADEIRTQADLAAERLEEQAKAVRKDQAQP